MTMSTRSKVVSRFLVVLVASLVALSAPLCAKAWATSSEPDIKEAQSAIIVDSTGKVLWSKNADAQLPEASITKIMTAMVALDSGVSMDAVCDLTDVDLTEAAQRAGYAAGQTATFYDLMRVMLVYSANDAAAEIARKVAGSDEAFVALMNKKAQEIGMKNTHFANMHGLDADGHYSTCTDLVVMARYAMTHYPFIEKWVHTPSVTVTVNGQSATFETTDELMSTYEGLLGIKTGAGDTGYTFLGCSRRDNTQIYTCVLGCSTSEGRFSDTATMMDWAYDTYGTYTLADANQVLRYVPFAYHFGWSCAVSADATTTGLIWPDGGATTYTQILSTAGQLAVPDEPYGVKIWMQDGRILDACSFSTKHTMVETTSFGLFNTALFIKPSQAA